MAEYCNNYCTAHTNGNTKQFMFTAYEANQKLMYISVQFRVRAM